MFRDLYVTRGPAAAFFQVGLFAGGFAALVPVLKPQAGLGDGAFGVALLVAALAALVGMALAPALAKRLGRHRLAWMMLVLIVTTLVPGFSQNGVFFAVSMAAALTASAVLDVTMNARVSEIEGVTGRPLMNLCHGIFSLAYAISALLVGLAREAGLGPVAIFGLIALAGLGLLAQTVAATGADSDAAPEDTPDQISAGVGRAIPLAFLIPGGLVVLAGFLAEQGTEGWSALHLERNFGASAAEGALGPAILGLTMAAGRFGGQALSHRISEARLLSVGATLAALGAIIAAWSTAQTAAYLGFALLGSGVSVVAPTALAWVGRMVPNSQKALAVSRMAMIGYSGFFIGPPMMGFLSEGFGLPVSFTAAGVLLLTIPLVLVPYLSRFEAGRHLRTAV